MPKAKSGLKEKAIKLRVEGKSYKEIEKELGVARSSLSLWLRAIKLTKKQRARLNKKISLSGARSGSVKSEQWRQTREQLFLLAQERHAAVQFSDSALALVGAALYWAEGQKKETMLFSNADPAMVSLYLTWLRNSLAVPEKDIKLIVYAHTNVGITKKEVLQYWSTVSGIEPEQITMYKAAVPKSSKGSKVGRLPYGTAHVRLRHTLVWRAHLSVLLEKLGKNMNYVEQPLSYSATTVIV